MRYEFAEASQLLAQDDAVDASIAASDRTGRYLPAELEQWPFVLQWCVTLAVEEFKTVSWNSITPAVSRKLADPGISLAHKFKVAEAEAFTKATVGVWLKTVQDVSDSAVDESRISYQAIIDDRSGVLRVRPLPPKLVASKRFAVKYGADRLLTVGIPMKLRGLGKIEKLRELARKPFQFAERTWELLVPRAESKNLGLQLFATSGRGLADVTTDAVRGWHFPNTPENRETHIAKFSSRFGLGFSDTTRTITVDPSFIRVVDDVKSPESGVVMTDGCSGISANLIKQVSSAFNASQDRRDDQYAAFQGRLASNKGMWYVDNSLPDNTVTVTASMHKYSIPNPTPEQLCIEVNSVVDSASATPARLNRQVLRLLEARGVTAEFFLGLQADRLKLLRRALTDNVALEKVMHAGSGPMEDQLLSMLKAEWDPSGWVFSSLRQQYLKGLLELDSAESKLEIDESRKVKILADPTGTLKPDECYVRVTGGKGLLQQKVLLARNPCYHPGELLLLTAVCPGPGQESLHDLVNVVVLSTQGVRPPADMMQGGDYDGDAVILIYDNRIIEQVKPMAPPEYRELGTKVPYPSIEASKDLISDMVEMWLRVVADGSKLGQLSHLHEFWADIAAGDWDSDAGRNAKALAELCFNEMDAWKDGRNVKPDLRLENVAAPSYHAASQNKKRGERASSSAVGRLAANAAAAAKDLAAHDFGAPSLDKDLDAVARLCADRNAVARVIRALKQGFVDLCVQLENSEIDKAELNHGVKVLIRTAKKALFVDKSDEERRRNAAAAFAYEVEECQQRYLQWRRHRGRSSHGIGAAPSADAGGKVSVAEQPPKFSSLVAKVAGRFASLILAMAHTPDGDAPVAMSQLGARQSSVGAKFFRR